MRIEETSSETIIHCGSEVDLSSVVGQKEIFLQALQIKKTICLEASEISKIDVAGIQLFLNFILAASKINIAYYWKNPASQIMELSELLGVTDVFAFKRTGSD
ncbi:MAG TPA: STAS domain-containing protein [Gammaproteobacteria bacterium]|nr:STAS domain-containing protein [Gammaproteobacteria bacterium]HRA42212.1 STAS domain-containing protein [Gammaproteobacteria bacterium]